MMKFIGRMSLLLFFLVLTAGCVSYARIDGPYEGKVIDAQTRQPVKGAVVLGVWNKYQFTVGGPTGEFYDSVEVLTDENGHFKIDGLGVRVLSNVDEMDIMIFKAGYSHLDYGPWSSYKTLTGSKDVEWDGEKMTVPLRKLSFEELRNRHVTRQGLPGSREKLMTREMNKDRVLLGYTPF